MIVNWIAPEEPGVAGPSFLSRRLVPMLSARAEVREWTATVSGWRSAAQPADETGALPPTPSWAELHRADISIFVLARAAGAEAARVADVARVHPGVVLLVDFVTDDLLGWAARWETPHREFELLCAVTDSSTAGRAHAGPYFRAGTDSRARRPHDSRAAVLRNALLAVVHERETADVLRAHATTPIHVFSPLSADSPDNDVERYADALVLLVRRLPARRHHALIPHLLARTGSALGSLGMFDIALGGVSAGVALLTSGENRSFPSAEDTVSAGRQCPDAVPR